MNTGHNKFNQVRLSDMCDVLFLFYRCKASLLKLSSFFLLCSALFSFQPAYAADHWLSRVNLNPRDASSVSSRAVAVTGTQATFDVTVSLDTDPQPGLEREAFEARLRFFARAVYQSTNRAHSIRKVTIFPKKPGSGQNLSTDVIWTENCSENNGPRANVSGFGVTGEHIWMCTNWPGSPSMSNAADSGYTLAHEWGHYAYALFDEYIPHEDRCGLIDRVLRRCGLSIPRTSDTAAEPSIMNNQWRASSDPQFLEFSTQNVAPFRSGDSGTNAQKRVYGASAWETLTRPVNQDPKWKDFPPRKHYFTGPPASPNWIETTSSFDTPLLLIQWSDGQVIDLAVDVSGSMSGSALTNAKLGANLLVDSISEGTALGISSFASGVVRRFSFQDILNQNSVRGDAKVVVNALAAGGQTALYNGLMKSLTDINAFSSTRPKVVFVLSDGANNVSGTTEQQVIDAYKAAGIPIISFAYGSAAPSGSLYRMASQTGGSFYQSPTNAADIQAALVFANAKYSSQSVIAKQGRSVSPNTSITQSVFFDNTIGSAIATIGFRGAATDIRLRLLSPAGNASNVNFSCAGVGEVTCSAQISEADISLYGSGEYRIEVTNMSSNGVIVSILVSATSAVNHPYRLAASFEKREISYPADLRLIAKVDRGGLAISGLNVSARITPNSGTGVVFDVVLRDDGLGADRLADDGIYSASIPYAESGVYSAEISANNLLGTAATSLRGVALAQRQDGRSWQFEPEQISERFVRVETVSSSVSGLLPDDHSASPGSCTQIATDNVDHAGRIDVAGDQDCFAIAPSPGQSLIIRLTSLTADMEPVLTVLDRTGVRQIAQATLLTSEAPDSGVILTIPSSSVDTSGMIASVRHVSGTASRGGYLVSAGGSLLSDFRASSTGSLVTPTCGLTANPAAIAPGTSVTLTASCSPTADSFIWTGDLCSLVRGSVCTVTPTRTSTYTVTGINSAGSGAVASTTVSVNDVASSRGKLVNLSTRAQVGSGDNVLIAGFIISGGPKTVVIKAEGPSLAAFGVNGVLNDPTLTLFSGAQQIASNDDYPSNSSSSLRTVSDAGLTPSDPRESVIVTTLTPGAYTAIVRGFNGSTGIAIVSVNDLDPQSSPSRLTNISSRAVAATSGDGQVIAGFIVRGGSNRLILKGTGPSLLRQGVSGALSDPVITLYNGSSRINANDDWASSEAFGEINASALAPSDALESAIVHNQSDGSSTLIMSGLRYSGVGLVSIDEFSSTTSVPRMLSTSPTDTSVERVFAKIEKMFAQELVNTSAQTQLSSGYFFRTYSGGHYIAVNNSGTQRVFYYGPLSAGTLIDIGGLFDWLHK